MRGSCPAGIMWKASSCHLGNDPQPLAALAGEAAVSSSSDSHLSPDTLRNCLILRVSKPCSCGVTRGLFGDSGEKEGAAERRLHSQSSGLAVLSISFKLSRDVSINPINYKGLVCNLVCFPLVQPGLRRKIPHPPHKVWDVAVSGCQHQRKIVQRGETNVFWGLELV